MGAYGSKPSTETTDEKGSNGILSYGASSMQGWRVTQEDAHCVLLDVDEMNTQIFGVFDGHGGADVAQFAAQYLPQRLKELPEFKSGDLEAALVKGFLDFDRSLMEDGVQEQLKILAGVDEASEEEDVKEETDLLRQEAQMDIQDLVAKYEKENPNSIPPHLKKSLVGLSPMIRRKKDNEAGPSSSGSSSRTDIDIPSSSKNETQDTETKSDVAQVKTTNGEQLKETNGNGKIEENGAADILEEKAGGDVAVETSKKEEVIEEQPKKVDKGKRIVPKAVPMPKKEQDPDAAYADFLEDRDSSEEEDEAEFKPFNDSDDDSEDEVNDDDGDDDSEDDDEEEEETSDEEETDGMFGIEKDFEEPGKDSGCTAVVAVLRDDVLYVANAGDSRCVVSQNGTAVDMSVDHKPEDDIEMNRITKAGGVVTPDGRVNGGLNLSRALGDHTYKTNADLRLEEQMISPMPDVKKIGVDSSTDFMVLACDGIWNSMTSQEVVDFVAERLDSKSPVSICKDLFHHCLAPDTTGDGTGCDNMTAIIVKFGKESKTNNKRKAEEETEEPESKRSKEDTQDGQ